MRNGSVHHTVESNHAVLHSGVYLDTGRAKAHPVVCPYAVLIRSVVLGALHAGESVGLRRLQRLAARIWFRKFRDLRCRNASAHIFRSPDLWAVKCFVSRGARQTSCIGGSTNWLALPVSSTSLAERIAALDGSPTPRCRRTVTSPLRCYCGVRSEQKPDDFCERNKIISVFIDNTAENAAIWVR